MSDVINNIYLNIAKGIVDVIDSNWSVAIIKFDYMGGAGEFDCTYKDSELSEVENDFDVDYSMYKLFKELHQVMNEREAHTWNRARFTLYPTGKFSIDFEWDQALADEVEANS